MELLAGEQNWLREHPATYCSLEETYNLNYFPYYENYSQKENLNHKNLNLHVTLYFQ